MGEDSWSAGLWEAALTRGPSSPSGSGETYLWPGGWWPAAAALHREASGWLGSWCCVGVWLESGVLELVRGSESCCGALGLPRAPFMLETPELRAREIPGVQGVSLQPERTSLLPLAPLPRIRLWDFCFLPQSPKGEGVTCFAGQVTAGGLGGGRSSETSESPVLRARWVTRVMCTWAPRHLGFHLVYYSDLRGWKLVLFFECGRLTHSLKRHLPSLIPREVVCFCQLFLW